jgi:phosphoribosyl-ATP pyrophosphohydrolase
MGQVTSSSVAASLEERNGSVVDEAADLALHLSWCLTASHQWRRLNSEPVQFLYRYFVVLRTMALSAPLCLEEDYRL